MARIVPIDIIRGISGKYGSSITDYLTINSSSNHIHLAKYLNYLKHLLLFGGFLNRTHVFNTNSINQIWGNGQIFSAEKNKLYGFFAIFVQLLFKIHEKIIHNIVFRHVDVGMSG